MIFCYSVWAPDNLHLNLILIVRVSPAASEFLEILLDGIKGHGWSSPPLLYPGLPPTALFIRVLPIDSYYSSGQLLNTSLGTSIDSV